MRKIRLDTLLVNRGLVETKSKAQASIMAGDVIVNGQVATKAGAMVSDEAAIEIKQKLRYASRGGFKLQHALDVFGIHVNDRTCLDVGASTGGFTDCLLQSGVKKVYALDVGYGQLDYKLRRDSRVIVMEKINAHFAFELPEKVSLVTMDLSFISVTRVIPNVVPHLEPSADMIVLFKPQFEAERGDVGKGGVIRDPAIHARAIGNFIVWMNKNRLQLKNLTASPILGAEGNREFLLFMRPLP